MTLEIVTYFLFFVAFGTTKAANENSVKIDLPQWAIPRYMNGEIGMDECGVYQNWKAYMRGNSLYCKGDGYQCEDLTFVCNDIWTNRACQPLQNDPGAEIYGWIQEKKTSCPRVMMSHILDEVSGPMQIFASYVNHANSTEHAALRVNGTKRVNSAPFALVETLEHCGDWSDYVMMNMRHNYCNIYTYDPSQRRKFKRNSVSQCDSAVQIFRSGAWQPIRKMEDVDDIYIGIRVTDSSSVSCPKIVVQLEKNWNPNTDDPGWTKFLVETNPHKPKVEEAESKAGPGWSSLNPSIHFTRNDQGHLKEVKIAFDMVSNVTDIDAGRLGFLEDILKTIAEPIEMKPLPPPPPPTTTPAGSPPPSYPSYTTAPYY